MTDQEQNHTATQSTKGRGKPDLLGYAVTNRGDGKNAIWTQIAAGWLHKDGKGYDVPLQAFPVDGRLTLRFRDVSDDDDAPAVDHAAPTPASE